MEKFFKEVIENQLDTKAKISIFVSSTGSWIKGIKVISLNRDILRYTYYEYNPRERNPEKRLIERITPLWGILDIKLESPMKKDVEDLKKDLEYDLVEIPFEEDEEDEDEDDGEYIYFS